MKVYVFIPCQRIYMYSQSECRIVVVYGMVLYVRCPYVELIVLATVIAKAWYKIVMRFLVVYHGLSHLSLVFLGIYK